MHQSIIYIYIYIYTSMYLVSSMNFCKKNFAI